MNKLNEKHLDAVKYLISRYRSIKVKDIGDENDSYPTKIHNIKAYTRRKPEDCDLCETKDSFGCSGCIHHLTKTACFHQKTYMDIFANGCKYTRLKLKNNCKERANFLQGLLDYYYANVGKEKCMAEKLLETL